MSIGEPINYQPSFLVLFTNQLYSPRVSWAVIALGLEEYGKPPILAGLLALTTHFPMGKVLVHYPHVEESSHTPLTPRRFSSCTHVHAGIFSLCTHMVELPHIFGLLHVFLHMGSHFLQSPQIGNSFLVMVGRWVSSPTIWLHFPIVFQAGNCFW